MLVAPENIELNKLVKKRVLNFDTPKRSYGNLVIVATDTYDDYESVFTSKLFKPQQMYSVFSPRKIKPLNRGFVTFNQKDTYDLIKSKTNGFIKIGKAMLSSYSGKNLSYDFIPEYTETLKLYSSIRNSLPSIHAFMQQFIGTFVYDKTNELNYEKNYLIFPLCRYVEDLRHQVNVISSESTAPFVEFLKSLKNKSINLSNYEKIDRVIFYNPNANAMVVMDLKNPSLLDDYNLYFEKINRLNKFNNNTDSLSDIEDDDKLSTTNSESDFVENTKEKIKEIVLGKISKQLKANLTDYDAATSDEQGLINSIDSIIDDYLSKPENVSKPFADLVSAIETNPNIINKSINYIERKKVGQKQLLQLSKNLSKEAEIINSISDLATDDDKSISPELVRENMPKDLNKEVQESTLYMLDEKYNNEQANIDLMNNLTAFSSQDYLPLSLDNFERYDSSDDFTLKETISVRYKTDEGKTLTFKLDIPKIFNGHYMKVKGNNYIIQKQICRLPIVKTKDNRVEITTNFNKITCERTNGKIFRRNEYLKKILPKYFDKPAYTIIYGYNTELNSQYSNDFEYDEMSSFLSMVKFLNIEINLNRPDVEKEIKLLNYPDDFITENMTPVGFKTYDENTKSVLFINNTNQKLFEASIVDSKVITKEISENLFTYIVKDILGDNPDNAIKIGQSFVYSKCKFIAVVYPILVLCGLCDGLTTILKKAKIEYTLSDKKLELGNSYVEVRFKNKFFYYKDTIENTLLLNVLYAMNTSDYNFEEFDTDRPFIDYCVDMLNQPIYVKQTVSINISKLVDPITADVLRYLNLPTDPVDLLLLANKMLTTNAYITKNNLCNYRIRGNELIYAIMYEIIAKAYMTYQRSKLNGSNKETIKIPQNALIAALIQQQIINVASDLNPVLEVEAGSGCSMKGFKGINLSSAFTTELRSFDESMNGILSANSTPFSGSVGIQRSLTVNPKIEHIRGYLNTDNNVNNLSSANRLSASELLSCGTAAHSDAPRAAMQVSQAKHGVPVKVTNRQLIGSGYDRVIAYSISDTFCFKAKKAGIVESIDNAEQIAILKYDDGTYDAIDLKENMSKNSNSGFYINQKFEMKYNINEHFEKNDVIAINPSFFQGRGNNCAYTQGTLAKVAVTSGDFVFEDATYVSERLSKKCSSEITLNKNVVLGPNAIIHNMVKVGDHVKVNDVLLDFTTSFNDATTTEFLQDLLDTVGDELTDEIGNELVLSKYEGRIADIDIYYNVPFESLSPSIQQTIKEYNKFNQLRRDALIKKGIPTSAIKLKVSEQVSETKINATEFEGVLITFYISHYDDLRIGDKLSYSVALKGILSKVSSNEDCPFSEFRENEIIDGCTAASGIPSRLTMDVFFQLYGNKLLIELGRWIHKEWNSN